MHWTSQHIWIYKIYKYKKKQEGRSYGCLCEGTYEGHFEETHYITQDSQNKDRMILPNPRRNRHVGDFHEGYQKLEKKIGCDVKDTFVAETTFWDEILNGYS